MFREASVLKKMIFFEGRDVYLERNNPAMQLVGFSGNQKIIKLGKKIHLECGDTIIVTFQTEHELFVTIANYCGMGVFIEKFYMSAEKTKSKLIKQCLDYLPENERKIVLKNLAACTVLQ